MNAEYYICNHCKIKNTCHPDLLPIIVGRDGRAIKVSKMHQEAVYSTRCGRYTCSTDGEYVARQLMEDVEKYEEFEGTELDGAVHTLIGAVLSTSEKETGRLRLRMVTPTAHVYALQNGVYYFAQDLNSEV